MHIRRVFWMVVWFIAAAGLTPGVPVRSGAPGGGAQGQVQASMELSSGVSRAGVGFYTQQRWGLVGSTIVNHESQAREPLLVLSSRATEQVQFARRVWVPPHSRRTTHTPILLLEPPRKNLSGVDVEARLIDDRSSRETVIGGRPVIGALNVRGRGVETAVISGLEDATVELSSALRKAQGLPATTAYLSDDAVPAITAGWDAIDVVVISREYPRLDAAQIEALRRWVVGGGRLWINLERVDPAFVQRLLPGDWNVAVLDRVEMTDLTIQGDESSHRVEADYPYQMLRIAAPDMEVIHAVDGFPASLRKRVGRGQLLVTTLESAAWLSEGDTISPVLRDLMWITRRDALAGHTADESAPTGPAVGAVEASILAAVAREQIGYTVLSRGPVLVVLGVFTLVLLGSGLMLAQRGRLASLGWVAPVLAVVTAGIILALGLLRQIEDPFTLAVAQWIEVPAGQPYVKVDVLASIYTPPFASAGTDAALSGTGGVLWPDLSARGGATVRMLWTDDQTWSYPNLAMREGSVQTAWGSMVLPVTEPMQAAVRFIGDGLAGQVEVGQMGMLEDAVIVTPGGKLPVALDEQGQFSAPLIDPLAREQFFARGILGQRQIWRQAVYRELLEQPTFPVEPMLLGWSGGVDVEVTLSDQARQRRMALVALPLEIQRPEPGERVGVPAAFLSMSSFRDEGGKHVGASVYDERNRQWIFPISQPQTVLMRFTLPSALRGLDVERATISFDLDAPGRPYAVVVYEDGALREVARGENPSGSHRVEVSGVDAPRVDAAGGVVVGLRVDEMADPMGREAWSLTSLNVGVSGTMNP